MNIARCNPLTVSIALAAMVVAGPGSEGRACQEQESGLSRSFLQWRVGDDGVFNLYQVGDGLHEVGVSEPSGAKILGYCWGDQLAEGIPADRARSTYVYPVRTLSGVDLVDDFPDSHHHHRGISWMWPRVTVCGKTYDLWTLDGIRQEFAVLRQMTAGQAFAELRVQNEWRADGRVVMDEDLSLRVYPWTPLADEQPSVLVLDFEIALRAMAFPVGLAGQSNENKGYGGFGLRVPPRKEARIFSERGPEPEDTLHVRHQWVDYTALFSAGPVQPKQLCGVAILSHPSNPGSPDRWPNEWLVRDYGYIGESWPALTAVTIRPNETVTLRYRVVFHTGEAEAAGIADRFTRYAETPAKPSER